MRRVRVVLVVLGATLGVFATAVAGHPPRTAQAVDYAPASMDTFGITFSPKSVATGARPVLPDGTLGISGGDALASATQHAEAVDANHQVLPGVQVSLQYGILSDSHIQTMTPAGEAPVYQSAPSWVVTFTGAGVNIFSSGPVGSPALVHHEESVVIDARTGQFMFSYS